MSRSWSFSDPTINFETHGFPAPRFQRLPRASVPSLRALDLPDALKLPKVKHVIIDAALLLLGSLLADARQRANGDSASVSRCVRFHRRQRTTGGGRRSWQNFCEGGERCASWR